MRDRLYKTNLALLGSFWGVLGLVTAAAKVWSGSLDYSGVGVPSVSLPLRPLLALPELGLAVVGFALTVLVVDVVVGRMRAAAVGSLFLVGSSWALLEVFSRVFFGMTGSTVDYSLIRFAIIGFMGLAPIFRSGLPMVVPFLLVGWFAWCGALLGWVSAPEERLGRRTRVVLAIAGLAGGVMALLPLPLVENSRFLRSTTANLVLSAYDLAAEQELTGPVPVFPDQARLVGEPEVQRNVVVIALESTSWQWTSLADPTLDTTPFLVDLASRSTLVERAYTPVPHTTKAMVSMMCAVEPRLRTNVFETLEGGLHSRCLPHLLRDRGYRSAFFQSSYASFENRPGLIGNLGFDQGFYYADMDPTLPLTNYLGSRERATLAPSMEWLVAEEGPFFTFYLTLSPHHAYELMDESAWLTENREVVTAAYRRVLRVQDEFLADLFQAFKDRGLYENTLFVLMGDHGEGFGEHGALGHNDTIHEEGIRIPLIIHRGWDPRPEVLPGPYVHQDLTPSVIAALGLELDLEGGSISGMPVHEIPRDRVVYTHCFSARACMARQEGRWKYIDFFGNRPAQLFDLEVDPGETTNLADDHPELVARAAEDLRRWRLTSMTRYATYDRR